MHRANNNAADSVHFSPERRKLLRGLGGMAAASLFAAPAPANPVVGNKGEQRIRFTLDWAIEGPSAPFYLAAERGHLRDEKLAVFFEPGKGSAGAIGAVAEGRFDMGIADLNALIEYKGKKPDAPVQAVYIAYNATPASIMTLKRSDYNISKRFTIAGVKDLAGKTLGAPGFDAARKMWPMLAQANGLDPSAVQWLDVSPARRESDLLLGRFDAISGFHYTSELNLLARGSKPEDIVTFRFVDHGVPLYGNALIVNSEFAASAPKAVGAFVRVFNQALRETIRNPRAGLAAVLVHANHLDEATEAKRLALCVEHNVMTQDVKAQGFGGVDPKRLQRSIDELAATFKLPNRPAMEAVFTDRYLPAAADRKPV
jgi:NitT/TauT family transport system substrate-binding protein